jgi:3-dehydroquinate dehydratase / shikimate dehydrogenase
VAVVVSHVAPTLERLVEQAARQAPLADLVELRLDRVGNPGADRLRAAIAAVKKPVIVAVHGPEAFGTFEGDVDERLDLLRTAARSGASFVDVDWRLSLELGEVRGEGKCHRIVSRHDTEGTPEDLETFTEEVREVLYEGDLVKVVTHAARVEDGLRMLRHVRATGGGLIGFCSGPAGSFTRLLAPIFGSPFTYAAPAAIPGRPAPEATAPGQVPVNDLRALFPPGGLSVETAILGVVGNPARHSWSPRVHGMALKAARLDAVYVPFEVADFALFRELAADASFRGFSITAPFKEAAFAASHSTDAASQAARSTNTWIREQHGWRGLNTDVAAVRETLEAAFRIHGTTPGRPVALGAARVLVLGTGGAARAAAQAAREAGARVAVAGRDAQKAAALAEELAGERVAWDAVARFEHDVLVHCTPVGSLALPDRLPVPADAIRPGTLVLDAVYRPLKTPLLAEAVRKGCTAIPGGEWFVRQAATQFKLFTGQEPDIALMRAAFDHAYAEDRAQPT